MSKDPLVVLGARVIDGHPSRMLEARLSTALSTYLSAPPRPVVVTGRGEASVMAHWLAQRGVAETDIIVEPEATSTNENLERSRALFPHAQRLTVITNGFHVGRTRVWAAHLGIPVTVIAAPTPQSSRLKNYAREVVALPHSVTRVMWRKFARRYLGR